MSVCVKGLKNKSLVSCPKSLWEHSRKINQYSIKATSGFFFFVCFSRSFKAGFLRVWSIDLLPLTPPRSPRNRFLGPHLKYTESEPQRGLPGCCIFIGFDFLESNLKYASQTILIRLKLETLSSPHQEALSLLSMNRVCALPAGSPSEPCCLSPLLRLKDLLLREPALSQLE